MAGSLKVVAGVCHKGAIHTPQAGLGLYGDICELYGG